MVLNRICETWYFAPHGDPVNNEKELIIVLILDNIINERNLQTTQIPKMSIQFIKRLTVLTITCIFLVACRQEDDENKRDILLAENNKIDLIFYQNDTETKAEFELGLKWAFSFLGARLERGSWDRAMVWQSPTTFQINMSELGFNQNAAEQLENLIRQFKISEEYLVKGGIDAGRFVVCTLNNSNHYYKIVGMPTSFNKYVSSKSFLQKRGAIIESAVALKERLIQLPEENSPINRLSYLAEELSGSLRDSSHQVLENEVMDVMENGQLRFGVYDTLGQLIVGSDPTISIAGKPVKCLWCHETVIQRGFAALTSIPGYYSPAQFDSIIDKNSLTLDAYRKGLDTEIDFADPSNHTKVEKLYFRFMEPSANRLSLEWGVSVNEVELLLKDIETHGHQEFPSFGQLYYRTDIEKFSPYATLPSTSSIRETNINEPNLLP